MENIATKLAENIFLPIAAGVFILVLVIARYFELV